MTSPPMNDENMKDEGRGENDDVTKEFDDFRVARVDDEGAAGKDAPGPPSIDPADAPPDLDPTRRLQTPREPTEPIVADEAAEPIDPPLADVVFEPRPVRISTPQSPVELSRLLSLSRRRFATLAAFAEALI